MASEDVLLSSFGSLSRATGVAVDQATGNVYAADGGGPEVVDVFGPDGGAPVGGAPSTLTGAETPAGSFDFASEPVGVAVDNSTGPSAQDIYVTDVTGAGEHEVLDKFTLNGVDEFEYLSRLVGFSEPVGTAVDADGNVYIADYGHDMVREFSAVGSEIAQLTSPLIEHPLGLAVDAQGDVYVSGYGAEGNLIELKRDSSVATTVSSETTMAPGGVTAIAIDRTGGRLLVDFGSYVAEYDPEGHRIGQFGAGTLGMSLGIAVNEATGKIYVSDSEKARIDIFGIPPLVLPTVEEESASHIGSASADVSAQINPGLRETKYFFQFGTTSAYENGAAPLPLGGNIGASASNQVARAVLQGLAPGTVYHYRVEATNKAGTAYGPDMIFKTFPEQSGLILPDGRVWEMVSPLEKNGGNITGIRGDNGGGVIQATPEGNAITYVSAASFGNAQGAPSGSQYLSTRTVEGWSTQNITTPLRSDTYFHAGSGTPYKALSTNLSLGLLPNAETPGRVENLPSTGSGAPPGYRNLYLHEIGSEDTLALLTNTPEESPEEFLLTFKTATPDLSHVVMSTSAALVHGASYNRNGNLYEWSRAGLHAINVLPGAAEGETAPEPAVLGSGENEGNVISEDGSRIYWSYKVGSERHLYVRENGTSTVQVDVAAKGTGLGSGESELTQFWTASDDGSKAFFTSDAPLTNNANTGPPCGSGCRREGHDLYLFNATSDTLIDLTPDMADRNGASVKGVLGASSDGSYVYFVATARLAGANAEGHMPEVDGDNLYLWHEGEGLTFIATLSSGDQTGLDELGNANDWDPSLGRRTARVTPDGVHLAFMSDASLTGYNNTDANTGARDEEVYLYDATMHELVCASCNPSLGRPIGSSSIPGGTIFSNEGGIGGGAALRQSRVLSENGSRLFFDSSDALASQDTNGKQDVYEYEDGHVYLLSGGTSDEDSSFVEASTNGDSVFFITSQQLVSRDTDQLFDLYDARVNGGFSETSANPACEGESCRLPTSTAPVFGPPVTAAVGGVGNLLPITQSAVTGKKKAKAKTKQRKHVSKARRGRRAKARKARRATVRSLRGGSRR